MIADEKKSTDEKLDAIWDAIEHLRQTSLDIERLWKAIFEADDRLDKCESAIRIFKNMLKDAKVPPFDLVDNPLSSRRQYVWRDNVKNYVHDTVIINNIIDHFEQSGMLTIEDFDDICIQAKEEWNQHKIEGGSNIVK